MTANYCSCVAMGWQAERGSGGASKERHSDSGPYRQPKTQFITTTKARRRVKTESRRRSGTTIRDSVQLRHARARSLYGPTVRREARVATRAAGRGGNDLHTLSFSSPKTTHALRGAVLTAPQRSETEDPEADPRHGRRVDGTFDEDGPHGGPFLLERSNQIFYSRQEETFKAWSATRSS